LNKNNSILVQGNEFHKQRQFIKATSIPDNVKQVKEYGLSIDSRGFTIKKLILKIQFTDMSSSIASIAQIPKMKICKGSVPTQLIM
jgi:hypothetical protein